MHVQRAILGRGRQIYWQSVASVASRRIDGALIWRQLERRRRSWRDIGHRRKNFVINIVNIVNNSCCASVGFTLSDNSDFSLDLEVVEIPCNVTLLLFQCNYSLHSSSLSVTSVCDKSVFYTFALAFSKDKTLKMFLTRSEYDRGVNTFSPEGRLFQVEYAIEAIKLGSTAIGIATTEGVVLAVEKRITSTLMEPTTVEKIVEIDKHIGCAASGLMADSRTMIDRARVECQNHWFVYNEKMTVESTAQAVSNLAIQFGDSDDDGTAMSRPFGVAMLFAGIDEKGPQLYHMDPSGTFVQFDAKAIGSGSEGAQQNLQEVYHKSMTLKEALKAALTILKQVMEEKLNDTNIEVMTMTPGQLFHMFSKAELQELIDFNATSDETFIRPTADNFLPNLSQPSTSLKG